MNSKEKLAEIIYRCLKVREPYQYQGKNKIAYLSMTRSLDLRR